MNTALMIIDMQKEYFTGYSKESMTNASEYINEVLGYFRERKLPVLWVQDVDKINGIVPDTEGFELIDLLQKEDDEISIFKEYGNSFNKTECGNILKKQERRCCRDNRILCGALCFIYLSGGKGFGFYTRAAAEKRYGERRQ